MQLAINTNIRINLYRIVPIAIMLWPMGNAIADYAISPLMKPDRAAIAFSEPVYLSEGDMVAGYEVSSDYDLQRPHPVRGTIEPHYGIDLATPTGTKLVAPTDVSVHCWFDPSGGGEVATIKPSEGSEMKMLHLSTCVSGEYKQGQSFALTGSSGIGTGAHLDVRRSDKREPSLQDVEPYLTGQMSSGLNDRELTCAIGAAEGTLDRNCQPNQHYAGHIDPGNGASNLGSFSYQHGASSPEEADRKQLVRLRNAEQDIQAQAKQKFNKPLSKPALAAALDLWNQSPKAGNDFVEHLPSATPTTAQIVDARSRSYIDPTTGKLDAPGLGGVQEVRADQARRTKEVEQTLQQRRLQEMN